MDIKTPAHDINSRDGWERIWGEGIPDMSDDIKKMLYEWKENDDYLKVMIFFTGTCDYSEDRSEYLLRELMRGNI